MSQFASVRLLALSAAMVSLALPALAQDMAPPDGMPEAGPPPNFECATEPVTGSGPGFSSSRDASEEAAIEGWLEKATAIFPEATWDTAYQANLSCAVQGLYSKCFAQGIPCRPKSDEARADDAGDDTGDDAAEAPSE